MSELVGQSVEASALGLSRTERRLFESQLIHYFYQNHYLVLCEFSLLIRLLVLFGRKSHQWVSEVLRSCQKLHINDPLNHIRPALKNL